MLGMLRLGARSGYAIKKTADLSTKYFWPTSLAQVYPELARLEGDS
jgi:DNA-binding PadR family transcriptional regulator